MRRYGDQGATVVVGTGDRKRNFPIHRALLVKHSKFFEAVFTDGAKWREGRSNLVEMPEDDPDIFEVFSQFLYSGGKIYTIQDGDQKRGANGTTRDNEWNRLRDCWILGEKMLSSSFKDATTDALIEKIITTKRRPVAIHHGVYDNSAGARGMKKLLVDVAAWKWTTEAMASQTEVSKYPHFFFEVAVAMKQKQDSSTLLAPFERNTFCHYHDHRDAGSQCYKRMF